MEGIIYISLSTSLLLLHIFSNRWTVKLTHKRDLPRGPVFETQSSQCRGPRFDQSGS